MIGSIVGIILSILIIYALILIRKIVGNIAFIIGNIIINKAVLNYKKRKITLTAAVDDIMAFTKDIKYTAELLNIPIEKAAEVYKNDN